MEKEQRLLEYSDPEEVMRLVRKYLGKNVQLYISTRKDKKYMIEAPSGRWVHFGQMGYEDFTKHKSDKRRELFRRRNAKWADAPKWSPAWLSFWLLW